MDALTTISKLFAGNVISVPAYQRAYSWDTLDKTSHSHKQVNQFLDDLNDYINSHTERPYYFGHFLFEERSDTEYAVIDGQQRLTTIYIFLSALFAQLQNNRQLSEDECIAYENIIKHHSKYKFNTVHYDNQLLRDYVVDHTKTDHYGLETTSQKRIVAAYDFFVKELSALNEQQLLTLLNTVTHAACTTHIVQSEAEASQMFIFQNNRGKNPTQLEIIKAMFMYNIYVYGQEETDSLIEEVKSRFEHIYRAISDIEKLVKEDTILTLTQKVFFNSLWEDNAMEHINKALEKDNRLDFIRKFSLSLDRSFNNIARLNKDSKNDIHLETLLLAKHYDITLPFFIKAYSNNVSKEDISSLAEALSGLMLRDSVISTRADLRSRLKEEYEHFTTDIQPVINRVNMMKSTDNWWLGYWNNENLRNSLNGHWSSNWHNLAKILLWLYENHLIEEGKPGYKPARYADIEAPHLEHIAPQTNSEESVADGYDTYDDDFRDNYLLSLGNFLLLSAPHNESIGNRPFEVKRESYTQNLQQREIQDMTAQDHIWDKAKIQTRKEKIINLIMNKI